LPALACLRIDRQIDARSMKPSGDPDVVPLYRQNETLIRPQETTMKNFTRATIASLFAASLLAGGAMQANAGSKDSGPSLQEKEQMLDQSKTGSINSNMMSSDDMGSWDSGKINVVVVSTMRDDDPNRTTLQDRMKTNPDDVAALQSAIQNNAALKAQLESQNVQLNNIVAAEKATDGSVTFYVQ
jgi:hypothetical protein